MNAQQLDHLRKVLRYFGEVELRQYMELGEPAGHICESLQELQWYLSQERRKQTEGNGIVPPANDFDLAEIAA